MSDLVQPNLTSGRRRQLEVLEYLFDNPASSASVEVSLGPLAESLGNDSVQASVSTLIDRGYISSFASLAGYSGAILLPAGADIVEDVRSHREDPAERAMAVRDRILYWLYDQGPGAVPILSRFFESKYPYFYGQPFTVDDVDHGTRWLKSEGYLNGDGAWGAGIIRPSITTKGTRVVEQGRSVNVSEDRPPASSVSNVFHGATGNVAIGSSNFTQNSSMIGAAFDGLATVAQAAREASELLAVRGVDPDVLEEVLAEIDGISKSRAEAGVVHTALTKLQAVVAGGTGSAVGAVIVDRINSLLELLPG